MYRIRILPENTVCHFTKWSYLSKTRSIQKVHIQSENCALFKKERFRRIGVRGKGSLQNEIYRIKNTNLEELKAFSDRRSCRGSK
jgi:hypothetical protein